MKKYSVFTAMILLVMTLTLPVSAHCDTMDGPVVADARKALMHNNINYVLKWVETGSEKEVREAFLLAMKVRKVDQDAMTLADRYFFETVVRLHRMSEGMSFTGVKPAGTPVDEKIILADKSIETGELNQLLKHVSPDLVPGLTESFKKVMSLKNFDINSRHPIKIKIYLFCRERFRSVSESNRVMSMLHIRIELIGKAFFRRFHF